MQNYVLKNFSVNERLLEWLRLSYFMKQQKSTSEPTVLHAFTQKVRWQDHKHSATVRNYNPILFL